MHHAEPDIKFTFEKENTEGFPGCEVISYNLFIRNNLFLKRISFKPGGGGHPFNPSAPEVEAS